MIEISIDPVLLRLGPLTIRWYGIMIALVVATGLRIAFKELKRRGISEDILWSFLPWGGIGAVVGARLFHVVDKLDFYVQHPLAVFAFQEGGLAIYGAVLSGLTALLIYARLRPLPLGDLLDAVAPGLILAQAIGRLGCTINGDVPGLPAALPWSVTYTNPNAMAAFPGVPVHPTADYELLWDLGAFALLWAMRRLPLAKGSLLLMYLTLYSVGRFFITFFRVDQTVWMGLSQAQIISVITILFVVPLLLWLNWRHPQTNQVAA
jgi:phosphatidylglycerol:prolipoprotein diacylglycerol transferase